MQTPALVVIDGNSLMNRCFYGVRPLTTRDGRQTGALYGFLNLLLPYLEGRSPFLQGAPTHMAAAFDLHAPTFRHALYEGYKSGRRSMPEELRWQMGPAKELLAALGVTVLEREGFEADDFLGSLSALSEQAGMPAYLLTGDRDSLQLISEKTSVLLLKTGQTQLFDPARFLTEYGVPAERYLDVKALMGDSSDAIPGVPGVGEKTAFRLIEAYGSLDGLYTALDHALAGKEAGKKLPGVTPSLFAKLTQGRESAYLSYSLAKIVRDLPLEGGLDALRRKEVDAAALRQLLTALEFAGFLKRLGLISPGGTLPLPTASAVERETSGAGAQPLPFREDADGAHEKAPLSHPPKEGPEETPCGASGAQDGAAAGPSPVFVDLFSLPHEKTAAKEIEERLGGVSRAGLAIETDKETGAQTLFILPFPKEEGASAVGWKVPLSASAASAPADGKEAIREALGGFLAGKTGCRFTVFDAKHIRLVIHSLWGAVDLMPAFDIMLAGWMLNPDSPLDGGDGLFRLLLAHLGIAAEEAEAPSLLSHYPALEKVLHEKLCVEGEDKLYYEVELPLCSLLSDMEEAGAKVDVPGLISFGERLAEKAEALEKEIYTLAGHPFNVNSPKQLGVVLFEEMGLPSAKKTKRGYSTSAQVLEGLAPYAPIIPLIFEYRQAVKLRSTYALPLAAAADGNSRVHTSYRQTGTATGRLSSAEPNLQNIPVRTPLGREFRRYFLSEEGNVLVDADYSQIELRVLAALAGDEKMLAAFREGGDIHLATAAEVFGLPPEQVTPELRSRAKAVNFGIVYGISDFSLGRDLGVSKATAGEYIRGYKATYRGIDRFLTKAVADAKEIGYAKTALGRRRYIPELHSGKAVLRAFGERVARNSPIQGTAADIIKIAMLRTDAALRAAGLRARLILQIHDELIVESPEDEREAVEEILKTAMESVSDVLPGESPCGLPCGEGAPLLAATLQSGKSWYECK